MLKAIKEQIETAFKQDPGRQEHARSFALLSRRARDLDASDCPSVLSLASLCDCAADFPFFALVDGNRDPPGRLPSGGGSSSITGWGS